MLEDKIRHYAETGRMLLHTPEQHKGEDPYLREADFPALTNEPLPLERAYASFPEKPKKHSRCSDPANIVNHGIAIVYTFGKPYGIKLPKSGVGKAKIRRPPEENWTLKSAAGSRDPDGKWYVSLRFESETDGPDNRIDPGNAIASDDPSNGRYLDSNGELGWEHRFCRESEERLPMEQERLSRRRPGSQNCEKPRIKAAKVNKHKASQRRDFLHKKSAETASQYDVATAEGLTLQLMANRKFCHGWFACNNGTGRFLIMLEYRQAGRGHMFLCIDKWFCRRSSAHAAKRGRRCRCRNRPAAVPDAVP